MKIEKKTFYITIGLITFIILILLLEKSNIFQANQKREISHNVIVGQIEELGNLEVAKYGIQDVMQYKKTRTWLPNSEVSLLIKGEVIACINLTLIHENNVYTNKDSISIQLPMPQICHEKIDHSQSKIYNVSFGLWETTELVDEAYKEAERHLHETAINMGIETESEKNAEKIVTQLLKSIGFNKINITFSQSLNSLPKEN